MLKYLLTTSLWIALAMLFGRIFGFFREVLISRQFGISANADIVNALSITPELFSNLILGSALAGSFIPFFNQIESKKEQQDFFKTVASKTLLFGLLLWLVGALFAEPLVNLMAASLEGSNHALAVNLMRLSLFVIPLTLLTGIFTAHMQAQLKQVVPAYATLVFNSVLVFALLFWVQSPNMWAWALIFAAFLRVCFVWTNNRLGWSWWLFPSSSKISSHWSPFLTYYIQVWLGSALFLTLLPLLAKGAASHLGEGELSLFSYAQKLIELPNGLLISVIGLALLPQLSQLYREYHQSSDHLNTSSLDTFGFKILMITLAIACAVCFALLSISYEYSFLIFGLAGKLEAQNIQNIASLLSVGLWVIPAQAIIAITNALLLAQQRAKEMLMINACSIGAFLLTLVFMFVSDNESRNWVMATWVFASYIAAALMLIIVYKKQSFYIVRCLLYFALFLTLGALFLYLDFFLPILQLVDSSLNQPIQALILAIFSGALLLLLNLLILWPKILRH